ncbi:hypothetical protein HMPREF1544_11819, partial [Mucor circinelloides 1006PhL]
MAFSEYGNGCFYPKLQQQDLWCYFSQLCHSLQHVICNAVLAWFSAVCKLLVALFLSSGLVLSASRLKWRYSLVWCCLLQVICIATFLEFNGS